MFSQHHIHQPQAVSFPPPPVLPHDYMSLDDFEIILKDPIARAQFIACITNAHSENTVTKNAKPQLLKTEMCRFWEEHGTCRRNNCWFAHGKNELRNVDRHPKYKTKVCEAFSKTGKCGYGKRCVYIHPRYGDNDYPGKMNATTVVSQSLLDANGELSGFSNLSPTVWQDAVIAFKDRFASLSGSLNEEKQQAKENVCDLEQITRFNLQIAAQKSDSIPSTPLSRSRDPMACPMSSSPDSLLSTPSTVLMTPTTVVSHSPASSASSSTGGHYPLPPWRVDAKPLTQPNFDYFKKSAMSNPVSISKRRSPPLSISIKGKEKEADVFYSPNGFEVQRTKSLQSSFKGPRSSSGSSVQQANFSSTDEDIFVIEE